MVNRDINCPVCSSPWLGDFLSRKGVPAHQNLLMNDQQSAREIPRGDLDIMVCHECEFVFNKSFDLSKLKYGDDYENTQTYSPLFEEYLGGLVNYLIFEKGIQNCRIADVVICRHVIEHIPDPAVLLSTIRQALVGSSQARVFFETPCAEWILANKAIWDFFYEHCSYFSADSLTTAFEISGFVVDLNPKKQMRYVPGTGHLIVGYEELAKRGVSTAMVMNPNYFNEIKALLHNAQLKIDLLDGVVNYENDCRHEQKGSCSG